MQKTVVINVAGLTPQLLGQSTPHLNALIQRGKMATVQAVTPAVACTAQATYLTGAYPDQHGIVGNGWYFREECEIKFWRQSDKLVQAPKIWETARALSPKFTCANIFWWHNMYSLVDCFVAPRPIYTADGRKIPDIYTRPPELREDLRIQLGGRFPLFEFWGPNTSIRSSRWIADAAKWANQKYDPVLTLVYLPHLDYNLQRLGPKDPAIHKDLQEIDHLCGYLIDHFESCQAQIIVLSEYSTNQVSKAIPVNRILREHGLVAIREELGLELLDAGASAAFAVVDHQVAHIYLNDLSKVRQVREILEKTDGIEQVLDEAGKIKYHLNHPRAGDLVLISQPDAWFSYYYWLDDQRAPDFARTVDILRKPGYDPAELFVDPTLKHLQWKVGLNLLKGKLGFRYLMDVIPLDASLVKGSHGRMANSPDEGPLFITQQAPLLDKTSIDATEVHDLILKHLRADGKV